ncbi:purple acid phosphatase family protein [Tuwongella immobilis]|uniref:Calcineurin-like phosphoesterase domain-containing protein n=1 Tax=Tuwongella immobilis TaxID=692036 RepID=A0A6C2YTH2_9BACT|nr:metallophosphoesterase family protein [Tuwongella immobilis]VIP05010.1 metallophosphoesterase : Phosphodiesterase/alkaline phosphatase D OS=Singulisphaera acidiphila (strain ATCC BAA-1392 / DSM 18658 / VKM B-2454 / MOB10) GN=Sinac_6436 PE=4 SV=1: Metallophos [Tuwongella immobilis]VTS07378.1 metallophosphoesterase : Phosphodiesterase/alkaline phosphatase D OS=Singulisphaera acidiphila (strain ATCC BAA-1392 / DSM 18658 / VKM B-2454 / MOB10) GN=Sinac_6436 PE=4 SV=1: Metallophos [Tuwongella immobi
MTQLNRRSFFAASFASVAALPQLTAAESFVLPTIIGEDMPVQPSILFLTWHRDPTTTMVIQWVASKGEISDPTLYYRQATPHASSGLSLLLGNGGGFAPLTWFGQKAITKPYPKTDLTIFRVELTGLQPDTEYEFRVSKYSPNYRFRTMPAKATDTISFISGGDCGVNGHAIANNISAANQDPSFAIIGGDLGYDNGRHVEVSLAFLRNYSKHMVTRTGRLIPLIPCIGNHEVDGGYNKPREKAPFFYAIFDGLFPETGYNTLDFGDYLSLILLDTGHTSPIAGEQTAWLEQRLRDRIEHPHVMVVNHVPAYPSARKFEVTGDANRKHWVPLYQKYRVPVVLEHHDHTFKRTKPLLDGLAHSEGVVYLGDGSWGRLRALQPPEKLSYLAASSMDYHLTVHRLQGETRYHLALDERGRIMDATHTGQRTRGRVAVRG